MQDGVKFQVEVTDLLRTLEGKPDIVVEFDTEAEARAYADKYNSDARKYEQWVS